jgi:hypothetical protein
MWIEEKCQSRSEEVASTGPQNCLLALFHFGPSVIGHSRVTPLLLGPLTADDHVGIERKRAGELKLRQILPR